MIHNPRLAGQVIKKAMAHAATFTAMDDRLPNPDQLRRSSVAQPAPQGVQKLRDSNCRSMKVQWQVSGGCPHKSRRERFGFATAKTAVFWFSVMGLSGGALRQPGVEGSASALGLNQTVAVFTN